MLMIIRVLYPRYHILFLDVQKVAIRIGGRFNDQFSSIRELDFTHMLTVLNSSSHVINIGFQGGLVGDRFKMVLTHFDDSEEKSTAPSSQSER